MELRTYTIPGPEPEADVQFLRAPNKDWFLSRDGKYWMLEHRERGIIDAGPVPWDDLKIVYHGEMHDITHLLLQRVQAAAWEPEDGPPPLNVSGMRLLDQDMWWVTKDKRVLRVEEMEPGHIRNLYGFLLRRADNYKTRYELSIVSGPQPTGDAASDCFEDAMHGLFEQDAEKWMQEQPLMQRLQQLMVEGA